VNEPSQPISTQFPGIRTPWKAVRAEVAYAVQHDMRPGEPLPSLAELTEMYGVNRKTALKAPKALAAEGLIERVPGKPYRVPA
jgi:DNA-binding GntR family transcriptional regulator